MTGWAGLLHSRSARRRPSSSLCCWPMLTRRGAAPKPQPAASWPAWLQARTWTLPLLRQWWCRLVSWTWPSRYIRWHRAARGTYHHLEHGAAVCQRHLSVSCSSLHVFCVQAAGVDKQFQGLLEQAESAPMDEVPSVCEQLRSLVAELRPADALLSQAGTRSSRLTACDVRCRPSSPLPGSPRVCIPGNR